MSQKTWLKEFYPKPADKTTKKEAIQHSVKKWEGLLPDNLKKHNVTMNIDEVSVQDARGKEFLEVDQVTCSLCHHYFKVKSQGHSCNQCPLFKVRNSVACCDEGYYNQREEKDSPYGIMVEKGNPRPMLKWLRKALKAFG